jgi:acetyl-CoA acetyltransferase
MALYGTTSRQLGQIAAACRRHASLNPDAVMRTPITIDDHRNSRFIVEPLRLPDCCHISDGAACVIVTTREPARDLRQPLVIIAGMSQAYVTENLGREDWWYVPRQAVAVNDAYAMAGVGTSDIEVCQLCGNFTCSVLLRFEHAGSCKPGPS